MQVAEYTSEFGRWDEVERASDPRLRPYVHGYFATSSSLVRPARERHLPAAEVPMVLNFGASHTWVDARSGSGPQRLDHAWVTGLQTRHRFSEATGERRFMVVRFTPWGAHLFFHLSMDSLADRAVLLEQIDPAIAALVSDHVMAARGWAERFDAMEELIGSRVNRSLDAVGQSGQANSPRKPYLDGLAPSGGDVPGAGWAHIAAECGYFDQSHFIHEFRAFAGATPSQFLRGIPAP